MFWLAAAAADALWQLNYNASATRPKISQSQPQRDDIVGLSANAHPIQLHYCA
tara:strand:- start:578 stop:736 length:159 start_codon:yes stop_codon:yes gene_type:complete